MKKISKSTYLSWGRAHRYQHLVHPIHWQGEADIDFTKLNRPVLSYGLGRSYGDCCLNDEAYLLDASGLNRMIAFDQHTGLLECEAGVSLAEIIKVFLPRGWFPVVVPGTKFVSVGGAIANDIHGKNHHIEGTFGNQVKSLELLRSVDGRVRCDVVQNKELFAATIAGVGLTGMVLTAMLQLKRVTSAEIEYENLKMNSIDDFFRYSEESDGVYEYTVAWIDSTATGSSTGRGIFMRGRHKEGDPERLRNIQFSNRAKFHFPVEVPGMLLTGKTFRLMNNLYFHKQRKAVIRGSQPINSFFFPLDGIEQWNLAYGKSGFFQYQFVVPINQKAAIADALRLVAKSGTGSFVTVLKKFGSVPSVGMMSFPKEGYTLTLDFPNEGSRVNNLMKQLNELVIQAQGRIYPAKDAFMTPEMYRDGYPRLEEFRKHIDPAFSSTFWRRMQI